MARTSAVQRKTKETDLRVSIGAPAANDAFLAALRAEL